MYPCRELDCVPDIWSLVEWSDWLTPRNEKRRYDTVFFMCYSESKPEARPDMVEVTKTQVCMYTSCAWLVGMGGRFQQDIKMGD